MNLTRRFHDFVGLKLQPYPPLLTQQHFVVCPAGCSPPQARFTFAEDLQGNHYPSATTLEHMPYRCGWDSARLRMLYLLLITRGSDLCAVAAGAGAQPTALFWNFLARGEKRAKKGILHSKLKMSNNHCWSQLLNVCFRDVYYFRCLRKGEFLLSYFSCPEILFFKGFLDSHFPLLKHSCIAKEATDRVHDKCHNIL